MFAKNECVAVLGILLLDNRRELTNTTMRQEDDIMEAAGREEFDYIDGEGR